MLSLPFASEVGVVVVIAAVGVSERTTEVVVTMNNITVVLTKNPRSILKLPPFKNASQSRLSKTEPAVISSYSSRDKAPILHENEILHELKDSEQSSRDDDLRLLALSNAADT